MSLFCSCCAHKNAKPVFSYEKSDFNVSSKTYILGSIEIAFPRHTAFEGLFPFLDFNSFITTEKGASTVWSMQGINFKYRSCLVYRLELEMFFYSVTETLKIMRLPCSLSFKKGNGINLGHNCCRILKMLLTTFILRAFSVLVRITLSVARSAY